MSVSQELDRLERHPHVVRLRRSLAEHPPVVVEPEPHMRLAAILRAARDTRIHALVTWAAISTVKRWPTDIAADWRKRGWLDVENARTKQLFRLRTPVLDEATEHGDGMLDVARAAETLLCPWLIVHGDADETVLVGEAESLAASAGRNAELLRIAGATHTFNVAHGMTSPSPQLGEATDRTVRFFVDRLLAPAR